MPESSTAILAATIEPVVGALLAFLLFSQHLTPLGLIGLLMVVGGVATGYLKEGAGEQTPPAPPAPAT